MSENNLDAASNVGGAEDGALGAGGAPDTPGALSANGTPGALDAGGSPNGASGANLSPGADAASNVDGTDGASAQHRLVILGSMDEFVDLVNTAKARGYYTIVCDGYSDGPAKAVADKAYDVDVRDIERIAAICADENADGIIASFSDLLAECLVAIAAKTGLKSYSTPDRFAYLREKPLMKKMFAEAGVPTAKTVKVHRGTIAEDVAEIGFPCVVKPANGYGSRGIYVFDNCDDIAAHFEEIKSYSTCDFILAEELNHGHEINMMSWILDGEPVVLSIADRETSGEFEHDIPHVSRIVYPSCFASTVHAEARDILRRIAEYVGITTGPLSMQFFYSEDAGIKVCEAAGRFFGYEHELLTMASGFSMEDLLLDYVYDEPAMRKRLSVHSLDFANCSAGHYFHGYEGTIDAVEGVDELMAIPEVREVKNYYKPGDAILHGVGAKPYVERVFVCGDAREQIDDISAIVFENLKVLDANGKNLLYGNELSDYSDLDL